VSPELLGATMLVAMITGIFRGFPIALTLLFLGLGFAGSGHGQSLP
jgi:TRAP-type mannitol/chloroaromatic compound transport system permease large subunit